MVEVHPVDGAHQRWGEECRRPGADPLHLVVLGYAHFREGLDLLVLGEAYQRQVHAEDVLQQLPEARHPLLYSYGVVLHIAQVPLQLGVHTRVPKARAQASDDRSQGTGGPLELDHLTRELVDAPTNARVSREDLGLYL